MSAGGNVLLHMATKQPGRIQAMVLVSATPYFPVQARTIMSQYRDHLPEEQWAVLRRRHLGGRETWRMDEVRKRLERSGLSLEIDTSDTNPDHMLHMIDVAHRMGAKSMMDVEEALF